MVKRIIALVALLVLVAPGISSTQAATPAARHRPFIGRGQHLRVGSSTVVTGTLTALSGISLPATLSVSTAQGAVSVVLSSPSVRIVRRFNGRSALDELSLGDQIAARGVMSGTTFTATGVKDFSIQEAATRAVLQVTQTSATGFTGTVTKAMNKQITPFAVGATITVMVGSTTKIMVPAAAPATGVVAGSLTNIAVGQTVTILGVYNRVQKAYTSTLHVTVHKSS